MSDLLTEALVVDFGSGLGVELAYLAARGWRAVGIDLSFAAVKQAMTQGGEPLFVYANVLAASVRAQSVDVLLDRGCFHYLPVELRPTYSTEAQRILRPSGRLLLRACLSAAGQRNDINIETLRGVFDGWSFNAVSEALIASDTRSMPSLICRLERDGHSSSALEQPNTPTDGHS
ncbi:MAG TPA: class I SAM-dependent methyltransferase [Acidimicrobiales bacterium]|nr:class I SAM-dependent methyltransferase [Acidimicrobiales bacterium]